MNKVELLDAGTKQVALVGDSVRFSW